MDLRQRLAALQQKSGRAAVQPAPVSRSPLPYLVPLQNELGITYYNDKIYIDRHGQVDLKDFPPISTDTLRFLTLDSSLMDFDIRDVVFLDIETTGIAGGAGTLAFLVGLGFLDHGFFQVRQFFLQDVGEEAAFLHAIREFCGRFRFLITYNGKCFDSQILKNRFLIHRWEDPLIGKTHIDMLFIARRLWRRMLQDCDLENLERRILGFERTDDIPSYLIPSAYTDYLRFANGSLIQKVMHHNQWDVVSLAVLTARACLLPGYNENLSAEEHFSLSLLHERQGNFSRAIQHQLQALEHDSPIRYSILSSLARNLRRVKDRERMQWLLTQIPSETIQEGLCRQLCIICEHDLKDYVLALELAELQIRKLERFRGIAANNSLFLKQWHHRSQRLARKRNRAHSQK